MATPPHRRSPDGSTFETGAYVISTGGAADRQTALDFGAMEFVDLENDALGDVRAVDLVFEVIGGDIQKRSAGQVGSRAEALLAIEAGADIIVAQGAEAGGHGEHVRSTLTLVPELADPLVERSPSTLLCAAGGIADGRGLAAVLMLGADGALVGSRLWATPEATVPTGLHQAAIRADGDATTLSRSLDIARALGWPERYSCRVLHNRFTDAWEGREDELRAEGADGRRGVEGGIRSR